MFFSLFFALFRYLSLLFEHFRSFPDQITGYSWINLSFSLFFWPKYCNLVSVSVRLCCGTIQLLDIFCLVLSKWVDFHRYEQTPWMWRAWTAPEPTMKFRVKSYRRNFVRVSFEIHSNDGDPNWSLRGRSHIALTTTSVTVTNNDHWVTLFQIPVRFTTW